MREFRCEDVIPGCGAMFRADSDAEILSLATVHAGFGHSGTTPEMPPDIAARIRAAIREVSLH